MSIKEVFHVVCVLTSITLNVFLSALILLKSPKKLGNYKFLMIYTAGFEAFYALLDYFVKPLASSSGYAWYVIRRDAGMRHDVSLLILVVWCGLFGVSMAIFGVHFIYRAIHKKFYEKYLTGKRVLALFAIPVIVGVYWALVTHYNFIATDDNREYSRQFLQKFYEEPIENASYICAKFYLEDPKTGELTWNSRVWIGLANLQVMVLCSMFCVFYLGLRCYLKIRKQLGMLDVQSTSAQQLQSQLFFALVAQTAIPLIFMYIPCTILFSSAIFNVDVGSARSLVTFTISLYPVIDPLPNMLIIRNYRQAILDMLKVRTCCKSAEIDERRIPVEVIGADGNDHHHVSLSTIL